MANNTINPPQQEDRTQQHSAVAVRSGQTNAHDTLRNIGLVTAREYKNRIRQRSFIISTVILLILIFAATCVPTIIAYFSTRSSGPTSKLVLLNNAGAIAGLQGNSLTNYVSNNLNGSNTNNGTTTDASGGQSFTISTQAADTLDAQQTQLKKGSISIILLITRNTDQSLHFTYYTNTTDTTNLTPVQSLAGQLNFLDRASRLGLTPAQTNSLFTQPDFKVVNTQPQQGQRSDGDVITGYFVGYAGVLLIFISVYLYGLGVAMGVAEEKGTRIMEILINAATPLQLLFGKILGIGAAGLSQMTLLVIVGIGGLLLQTPLKNALLGTHSAGFNFDFTHVSITLLLLVLVYFLLGFLLYATLFAAAGAIVKRQDEVQNATQPITWLFMVGYLVSFAAASFSSETWFKVISFIPFWTPTTMLMRVGMGTAAGWEIALSIALMLVAIVVCTYISARIYRFGVLMYGQKPNLSGIIKIVRAR